MIKVKGRKKCANCGKRYNYYYAKGEDLKYKGKDDKCKFS